MKEKIKSTGQKSNYWKYFLVFIFLGWIYQNFQKKIVPHSLSSLQAFLVTALSVFLSIAALYFLILWITSLIRRRGSVEREENKKVKLAITIIFAIIFLAIIGSSLIISLNTQPNKLNAEQAAFLNEFSQKIEEFIALNDKLKTINQESTNIEDAQQMNRVLPELLSAAQELQVKIDDLKLLTEKNSEVFEGEREKKAVIVFRQAMGIRDRHNKKLIELTALGLQIDFTDPDEAKSNKWLEMADELYTIEGEIQAIQKDFQKAIQDLGQ